MAYGQNAPSCNPLIYFDTVWVMTLHTTNNIPSQKKYNVWILQAQLKPVGFDKQYAIT